MRNIRVRHRERNVLAVGPKAQLRLHIPAALLHQTRDEEDRELVEGERHERHIRRHRAEIDSLPPLVKLPTTFASPIASEENRRTIAREVKKPTVESTASINPVREPVLEVGKRLFAEAHEVHRRAALKPGIQRRPNRREDDGRMDARASP